MQYGEYKYDDDDLRYFLSRARERSEDQSLDGMTDYQALNYLKEKYPDAYQNVIPDSTTLKSGQIYKDHQDTLVKEIKEEYGISEESDKEYPEGFGGDVSARPKSHTDEHWSGAYFNIHPIGWLNDNWLVPDAIEKGIRQGANSSISGILYHLWTGRAPFELEETNMFQDALSLAAGMAYDWWFLGLTEGAGAAVHFAGSAAKQQAARQLAPILWRDAAAKSGLLTKAIGQETIEKTLAKKSLDFTAQRELLKKKAKKSGMEGVDAAFGKLDDDALKLAKSEVRKYTSGKHAQEYYSEGLEIAGQKLLNKPLLEEILHEGGRRSAITLGAYTFGENFTGQIRNNLIGINPETGRAFTNSEITGLKSRWAAGEEQPLRDALGGVDPLEVLYSTAHGAFGGYVAGSIGAVIKAGNAGAFHKGRTTRWEKGSAKVAELGDDIWQKTSVKFGAIPAEAIGFTASGMGIDAVFNTIFDEERTPFIDRESSIGEKFVHNLVTIGTLKGIQKGFDFGMEKAKYGKTVLQLANLRWRDDLNDTGKKVSAGVRDAKSRKILDELFEQSRAESNTEWSKRDKRIVKLVDRILEASEKLFIRKKPEAGQLVGKGRGGKQTGITVDEFKQLVVDVIELNKIEKKLLEDYTVLPDELLALGKDPLLKSIREDILDANGELGAKYVKVKREIEKAHEIQEQNLKEPDPKKHKQTEAEREAEEISRIEKIVKKEASYQFVSKDHPEADLSKPHQRVDLEGNMYYPRKKVEKSDAQKKAETWETQKGTIGQRKYGKDEVRKTEERTSTDEAINEVNLEIKKLFTMDSQGTSVKAVLGQFNTFLRWLSSQKPKGKSIRDATNEDFGVWLQKGNKSGPYSSQYFTNINRVKKAIAKYLPNIDERQATRQEADVLTVGQRDKVLKGKKILPVRRFVDYIKEKLGAGKAKEYKRGKNTIEKDEVNLVNFIIGFYGKRQTAIHGEGTTKALLLDNAKVTKDAIILEFGEKGKQVGSVFIPNEKMPNGINYYEVTKRIINKRKAETKGLSAKQYIEEPLIVFRGEDGKPSTKTKDGVTSTMAIDKKGIYDIVMKNLGLKRVHDIRQTFYSIANKLDKALGLKGTFSEYVEGGLIEHTIQDTASIFYGKGKFLNYDKETVQTRLGVLEEFHHMAGKYAELSSKHKGKVGSPGFKKDLREYYSERYGSAEQKSGRHSSNYKRDFDSITAKMKEVSEQRHALKEELKLPKHMQRYKKAKEESDRLISQWLQLVQERSLLKENYQLWQKGKNPLTMKSALTEEALKSQVDNVLNEMGYDKKRVKILSDRDVGWAGKVKKGIISLVSGKADETTIFHELVHVFYDGVVVPSGNKKLKFLWKKGLNELPEWALKHDKNRWLNFQERYGEKAAHEYLTQISGEWSLKKFNENTAIGKFGNWVREFMSEVKNFFGVGTPMDVARTYGKAVSKGFTPKQYLKAKTRYQKVLKDDDGPPASRKQMENLEDLLLEKRIVNAPDLYIRVLRDLGLLNEMTGAPIGGIGIKGGKVTGMSEKQADALYSYINEFWDADTQSYKKGTMAKNNPQWVHLNGTVHYLLNARGVPIEAERAMKIAVGMRGGSLKNATMPQMKAMIAQIEQVYTKVQDPVTPTFNSAMATEAARKPGKLSKWHEAVGMGAFASTMVLRTFGGERMKKLAQKIDDHYFTENRMVGRSMWFVNAAVHELGFANSGKTKYIPYIIDKIHSEPFMGPDGKLTLHKKQIPEGLEAFERAVERGVKDVAAGGKGTRESRAVQHIRDMLKYNWETAMRTAEKTITNPRVLSIWKETMEKKKVDSYFTRFLTNEAIEHLRFDGKILDKQVQKVRVQMIQQSTKELSDRLETIENLLQNATGRDKALLKKKKREATKELNEIIKDASTPGTKTYEDFKIEAGSHVTFMMGRGRTNVRNQHLMTRTAKFDSHLITEKGDIIKTYESSFDKVVGRYIRNMAKYNSTALHFPEFTNMKVKWEDLKQASGASYDILQQMSQAGGSELGSYTKLLFERRIGLEPSQLHTTAPVQSLTYLAKYSALFGLSSFLSGLKNMAIGTTNTVGIHGLPAFTVGLTHLFKSSSWEHARREGWFEIGTKDLEISGLSDKWMTWGSWMKPTEQVNRIVGGFAGEFAGRQLVKRAQGDGIGSVLLGDMVAFSPKQARAMLGKKFRISDSELEILLSYGMEGPPKNASKAHTKRIEKFQQQIAMKMQQYGHILTQGATGDPFLPLWFGRPAVKAATLFYRMAWSSTGNIQQYVVKPLLTNANPLPLARHVLAGNVAGKAVWAIYEKLLGQDPPKITEEEGAQLTQNLAKAEALGLWSFLLNPFVNPGQGLWGLVVNDAITQPAIARNTVYGLKWLFHVTGLNKILGNDDEVDQVALLNNTINDIVVASSHAQKIMTNATNKYKTKVKNIKTWKRAWLNSSGLWENHKQNSWDVKDDPEQQYYNLIKEAFWNNDLDAATRFYMATWYHFFDQSQVVSNGYLEGRVDDISRHARSRTDRRLKAVLDHMNPLSFPDDELKTTGLKKGINRKKEFLMYLGVKRADEALKSEKTYWHRRRKLAEKISAKWEQYGGYYGRGKVEDVMGVPPHQKWLGVISTDIFGDKIKLEESERFKYLGY